MAETGLTRISRVKAMALAEQRRRGAGMLLRLIEHPERTLNPVLFLLLLCNLVAATLVGVVADHLFGGLGRGRGHRLRGGGHLRLRRGRAEDLGRPAPRAGRPARPPRSSPPWSAFPPLRLADPRPDRGVQLLHCPARGSSRGPYVSEQELLAMADAAAEDDVIEREERTLIHSIIDFGDTVVREVMVPRPDMVAVESTARIADVVEIAIAAGFSRIPVLRRRASTTSSASCSSRT